MEETISHDDGIKNTGTPDGERQFPDKFMRRVKG
jgi:hypothetical protein